MDDNKPIIATTYRGGSPYQWLLTLTTDGYNKIISGRSKRTWGYEDLKPTAGYILDSVYKAGGQADRSKVMADIRVTVGSPQARQFLADLDMLAARGLIKIQYAHIMSER